MANVVPFGPTRLSMKVVIQTRSLSLLCRGFTEMKKLIRIITRVEGCHIRWHDDYSREALRRRLNEDGFYVLSGADDTLEAYAVCDNYSIGGLL